MHTILTKQAFVQKKEAIAIKMKVWSRGVVRAVLLTEHGAKCEAKINNY